jgi:hypothetical protein
MNEETILRQLSERSRGDEPPAIDVREAVTHRIAAVQAPRPNRLVWAFAGISAAAACLVAAVSFWMVQNAAEQRALALDLLPSFMAVTR